VTSIRGGRQRHVAASIAPGSLPFVTFVTFVIFVVAIFVVAVFVVPA
jgi:hypothetical protein